MHSSDPLTPHLGCWARVRRFDTRQLDAMDGADLWRLHAMRRTLWVVPRTDAGRLYAAVGAKISARERRRIEAGVDRDDAGAWLKHVESELLQAIRESPGITTRALKTHVPAMEARVKVGSGKWVSEVPVGSRLLFLLAMDQRIVRGPSTGTWKSSQYPWHAVEPVESVAPVDARKWLVMRYLERFAPVTTTDIRWWTGLTAAKVRVALAALEAVEVSLDSGTGWMLPEQTLPEGDGVALLPGLDPTPMGYKERDWFLGPHQAALFDRNGNVGPTIWVGGRIVGGWGVGPEGAVRLALLEEVSEASQRAIERERVALEAWLGGTQVSPRFRTPLEKQLSA